MEGSGRVKVDQNVERVEELTKQYAIHWTLNEVWRHRNLLAVLPMSYYIS